MKNIAKAALIAGAIAAGALGLAGTAQADSGAEHHARVAAEARAEGIPGTDRDFDLMSSTVCSMRAGLITPAEAAHILHDDFPATAAQVNAWSTKQAQHFETISRVYLCASLGIATALR
jgi:hypothetical protein